MFRRLAEAFGDKPLSSGDPHAEYINQQQTFYETLPNIMLSGTSGLAGLAKAIQSVDTLGKGLQDHAIPNPDQIVRSEMSADLAARAATCSKGSLDELLASKNMNDPIGCGWAYTKPKQGSPYPLVSRGALGNETGPLPSVATPEYKQWFFDLQEAKKQELMDRCKALKACTDVDQAVFQGTCGYCTETNQGVPIDTLGKPLYPGEPRANCSAIVRRSDQCPPPPSGPQPPTDRVCDPVNGRLSATCLYNQVLAGGCKDGGTLAIALSSSPNPSDYIGRIRGGDAMNLYQRVAQPPMSLDVFTQGQTTVDTVLREVRQLATNAAQPGSTAIGAAARDLCLRRGAIKGYDLCANLPDGTTSPFDMACLQSLFLKMGGQPAGSMYPTANNMNLYNAKGTLGAVKQYWNTLIQQMKGADSFADYATQRDAMDKFLGITLEKTIVRAPFQRGTEVFWFSPVPGNRNRIGGFLRRTIEPDIVRLPAGPSQVKQIGGGAFGCFVQMMDVWAPTDCAVKFRVVVDDGFWISVNQPADIDKRAMAAGWSTIDEPGLFENLGMQGPTPYQAGACSPMKAALPNIVKMYFEDAGGGWNAFEVTPQTCSGKNPFNPIYYSLTCEKRAPFLTYEVGKSGVFEELRNPGLFGQFLGVHNLDYHTRTDERVSVPGKKSFARINNANSLLDMPNIAFQSWKSMNVVFRMSTMPIKETLIKFAMAQFYLSIILTNTGGDTAQVSVEYNFGSGVKTESTPFYLYLGVWYMFYIHNNKTGMDIQCDWYDGFESRNGSGPTKQLIGNRPLWSTNGSWSPAPGQAGEACTVMLGSKGFTGLPGWPGMYSTASFNYDLAWVHFFDHRMSNEDVVREWKANWVYTQFPDSFNTYKTISS